MRRRTVDAWVGIAGQPRPDARSPIWWWWWWFRDGVIVTLSLSQSEEAGLYENVLFTAISYLLDTDTRHPDKVCICRIQR